MQRFHPDRARAGFTLVELLAVIAILGLLFSLAMPMVTKARAAGNLRACQSNLRNIAMSLKTYVDTRQGGKWPKYQGSQFLLVLHKDGEIRGDNLKVFTCPATDDVTWPPDREGEWGAGYEDWDAIDSSCISYAGRDNRNFGIRKDREDETVIAADDNEFRPNHSYITNIVYADGHIGQVDVKDFADQLVEDAEYVPVGPDSPHEELQKLLIE